jgi:hypothetical protein
MAAESGASNGSPSADALLDHLEAGLGSFAERGLFDEEGRGFSIPDPEVGTFLAADPPVEFMRLLPITASEARLAPDSRRRGACGPLPRASGLIVARCTCRTCVHR